MNRRELIRNIAAGTATVFVAPSLLSSCEKEDPDMNGDPQDTTLTIDLANSSNSSLANAGGSKVVDDVIVINTGDGFIALSSLCTHQGCQVSYDHSSENLPCPCHGSVFSTTGSVLEGPASTALKKYNVVQEGDILTIDLS